MRSLLGPDTELHGDSALWHTSTALGVGLKAFFDNDKKRRQVAKS
jgi:hypothetical protein